jgi:hypothetical protein
MPRSASQELVKQQKEYKLKDFEESMKSYIQSERFINIRKKEFNRETGRKAVVNQVNHWTPTAHCALLKVFSNARF